MESLKYCTVFNTFNETYGRSKIRLACVYLRNEALIVDDEDNVYNIINNAFKKVKILCGKQVIDFKYAYSNIDGKIGYHILALTEDKRIYGWGRNTFNQVSVLKVDEISEPERLLITTGPCKKLRKNLAIQVTRVTKGLKDTCQSCERLRNRLQINREPNEGMESDDQTNEGIESHDQTNEGIENDDQTNEGIESDDQTNEGIESHDQPNEEIESDDQTNEEMQSDDQLSNLPVRGTPVKNRLKRIFYRSCEMLRNRLRINRRRHRRRRRRRRQPNEGMESDDQTNEGIESDDQLNEEIESADQTNEGIESDDQTDEEIESDDQTNEEMQSDDQLSNLPVRVKPVTNRLKRFFYRSCERLINRQLINRRRRRQPNEREESDGQVQVISQPYERFTKIACGLGHCMAVTTENYIVLWGSNKYGQIGNGRRSFVEHAYKISIKNEENINTSKLLLACLEQEIPNTVIEEEGKIKSIACGSFHSLVLFENGNVYGWGNNERGQLGLIPNEDRLKPCLILSKIEEIVSVNLHTLALTKDGILYAMGDNSYAQLGNRDKSYYTVPIKYDMRFSKIATINGISMGLSSDGKCYIWGLYRIINKPTEVKPKEVKTAPKDLTLTYIIKPTEVKCKSFAKIAAKCLSLTYFTIKKEEQEISVDETVRNEDEEDDENDLIDLSSLIPIEDYNENDDDFNERSEDHEKEIQNMKERVHLLEKTKPIKVKCHQGDKIKQSVFDGNYTVPEVNMSHIN